VLHAGRPYPECGVVDGAPVLRYQSSHLSSSS
jgi:hypothetical protein